MAWIKLDFLDGCNCLHHSTSMSKEVTQLTITFWMQIRKQRICNSVIFITFLFYIKSYKNIKGMIFLLILYTK